MKNNEIIDNYKKSLEQKYNAVCFDIDGTLTKNNSKEIDERSIEIIADLLERRIPILLITGRGEKGLGDFVEDVHQKLINKYNVKFENLKKMYALTNDGARLFYTDDNKEHSIFNHNTYITTNEELQDLKIFNEKVLNILNQQSFKKNCKITYSVDSDNMNILNTRMVFNKQNIRLINSIIDIINETLKEYRLNNLVITRGIYKDKYIIQIGTTKKEVAIERAERLIGVPRNSMIRIGDCGDIRGNDYSMLNCEQGYSVDKTSGEINSCFPIFDSKGNILKGVEATLLLIKSAKLLPTVCLERADKNDYLNRYAVIESMMVKGKNEHLKVYNEIINNNFDLVNGVSDLFDESSGSIKIPMYEWILIDDKNPLKEVWGSFNEDKLLYSLRDDNNYLLRGSKTYYYFLANRESIGSNDYTSCDNVFEWYNNNIIFFENIYNALNQNYGFISISSKKMILGVLDNIRNILLTIINHNINADYSERNILININSKEDGYIYRLYKILYCNDSLMGKMIFSKDKINLKDIINLVDSIIDVLKLDFNKFKQNLQDKNYSKEYRAYREIDNFAENFITIKFNDEKKDIKGDFGVCGMCYGGLELPIIYKVINDKIDDVLLLKFNKKVSGYVNKQLMELRKFNINKYGGLFQVGDIKNNNIAILDDNMLTGKTIQLAINTLYDEKLNVSNIGIVRYPSVNRIDQMFMNNHAAVDYKLFFDYITGLCFPSPYSWRDQNNLDPYKDSLGVFDLNRKKIIECLVKNHDYKENSEVHEYKRRITNEEESSKHRRFGN